MRLEFPRGPAYELAAAVVFHGSAVKKKKRKDTPKGHPQPLGSQVIVLQRWMAIIGNCIAEMHYIERVERQRSSD